MKISKKRISALLAAAALSVCTAMSASGVSADQVRDANGDGEIRLNDTILTYQYLAGRFNPTNIKSFDFDGNGIISKMDADKVQNYTLWLLNDDNLPDPSTETVDAVTTTRTYLRHYCNSSDPRSYGSYALRVEPFDNTVQPESDGNPQQRSIIGDNDMIRDYDTAVVNLSSLGGSGFIVGKHVIATAAHCVYNGNRFYDQDELQIRLCDSQNNVKYISPKYVDIPREYYRDRYSRPNDYALIYVEEDLSQYGMLKMGVALDEYVDKNGGVIVSGFPSNKGYPDNYKNQPTGIRFKAKGKIVTGSEIELPGVLVYDADTYGGDSGGPVYAEEGFTVTSGNETINYDYKTVIGIHTDGYEVFGVNSGVRITPDILNFYYDNFNIDK